MTTEQIFASIGLTGDEIRAITREAARPVVKAKVKPDSGATRPTCLICGERATQDLTLSPALARAQDTSWPERPECCWESRS